MGRYDRNILIKQIGEEGQRKLKNSSVLVCGAGGLGSSVIANLASLGIGTIGIVDNDKIELSNLNRQFLHKIEFLGQYKTDSVNKWIKEFNPEIKTYTYKLYLDRNNASALMSNYDIIVDCFDNFASKFTLCKEALRLNKPLVHAGVEEFCGQVMTILPNCACLACFAPELYENECAAPNRGIASPVVSTIGSIQAMEVLKIILNIGIPICNCALMYNGLDQSFRKINISKNLNCPCCAKK